MMKKVYIFLVGLCVVFVTSCEEESFCKIAQVNIDKTQLAKDLELIDEYLNVNVLTAEVHSTGIRYIVADPGNTSIKATNCSRVRIIYEGRLLNNNIFDTTSGNHLDLSLSQLIPGWQHGLTLIGAGGKITLLIPSGYGYGPSELGSCSASPETCIPANSPLIFDIEILNIYN